MNRLTNKKLVNIEYGYVKTITKDEYRKQIAEAPSYKQLYDKLGQLENLEEELGCPLEVVFKALKEGIYCYDNDNEKVRRFIAPLQYNSTSKQFYWCGNNINYPDLKDYGKTWWLKGDKVE